MSWIDNNSATIPSWNFNGNVYPYFQLNKTIVQGLLDISGGNLILRNGGLFTQTDISSNGNLYAAKSYISGNLAIGKTTAGYTVDISGTAQIINSSSLASTNLMIDNNYTPFTAGNTTTSKISLYAQGLGGSIQAFNTYATAQGLIFNTFNGSDVERMRITNSGYVGIGTTTPAYTLDVQNTARIGSSGGGTLFISSGTNCYISNNTTVMTYSSATAHSFGQSVGIGTSTPAYTLDVNGNGRFIGGSIYFTTNNSSIINNGTLMTYSNAAGAHIFNQNVGILTSSPAYTLDVNGNGRFSGGTIYINNTGTGYISNNTSTMTYNTGGSHYFAQSVGILTSSPAYTLDVTGNGNFTGTVRASGSVLTSDDRVKTNEVFITNATTTLLKLRPQLYHKYQTFDCSGSYIVESGLIAQEIYYDAPELRHIVEVPPDATPADYIPSSPDPSIDPDYSSWGTTPAAVNYNGLIPYLIQTIKELNARIIILENK